MAPKDSLQHRSEVVYGLARQVLHYKYEIVATNINVDKATVWRIVKLFNETGQVTKKDYP